MCLNFIGFRKEFISEIKNREILCWKVGVWFIKNKEWNEENVNGIWIKIVRI